MKSNFDKILVEKTTKLGRREYQLSLVLMDWYWIGWVRLWLRRPIYNFLDLCGLVTSIEYINHMDMAHICEVWKGSNILVFLVCFFPLYYSSLSTQYFNIVWYSYWYIFLLFPIEHLVQRSLYIFYTFSAHMAIIRFLVRGPSHMAPGTKLCHYLVGAVASPRISKNLISQQDFYKAKTIPSKVALHVYT